MFPQAENPITTPTSPVIQPPENACDAHVHMVGGPDDFPLWEGRVEDPAPGDFEAWLERYRHHLDVLGFSRGVIVHSILYGDDNSITAATVKALGSDRFRGIGLVRDGADDLALDTLVTQHMAGIRLNYVHGGVLSFEGVMAMAPRLQDRGLHLQMLINAHKHMQDVADGVRALPMPVVFDHIAWPDLSLGIHEPGFQLLCQLLSEGHCYVKLSGIYRLCKAPYDVADEAVAALVTANSERCLWGSDWPHLMLADAKMPDAGVLLNAFFRAVPNAEHQQRILVDNPAALYGF